MTILEFLNNNSGIVAIVAAILAGLLATIANILYNIYRDKAKFKKEYIERQIKELYGPLNSFILQNKIYSERGDSIDEEYMKEFCGDKNYSSLVGDRVDQEASQTLTTYDEYYKKVLSNNKKIFQIISNNFHLFDIDDQKIVQENFIKDYICYEIEKNTPLPNRIARNLTKKDSPLYSIYMRPQLIRIIRNKSEFIEMIQNKYKQKQSQLIENNLGERKKYGEKQT